MMVFISTLEPCSEVWLHCSGLCAEFPGLVACPSLLLWGRQGDTETFGRIVLPDLGELQLPWGTCPVWHLGASLPDQLVLHGN